MTLQSHFLIRTSMYKTTTANLHRKNYLHIQNASIHEVEKDTNFQSNFQLSTQTISQHKTNLALILMQPANVYVEWWVGGDHLKNKKTKLLKQGVKKGRTKAEPSGQKKKKYKQLARLTHTAALYRYPNTFVNFKRNGLKMSHTIKGQRTQLYCSELQ